MRVKLFCSSSAFCQENLGGKCAQAGMERVRSGLVKNTVPFDSRKFQKFKSKFLVEWNAPKAFFEKMARTRTTIPTKVVYVLENLRIDLCWKLYLQRKWNEGRVNLFTQLSSLQLCRSKLINVKNLKWPKTQGKKINWNAERIVNHEIKYHFLSETVPVFNAFIYRYI